jgi:hypothetical protein
MAKSATAWVQLILDTGVEFMDSSNEKLAYADARTRVPISSGAAGHGSENFSR